MTGRTATGKLLCGATTRQGGECRKVAGYGTSHVGWGRCKFHGGSTPNGEKHAARQEQVTLAFSLLAATGHTPAVVARASKEYTRAFVLGLVDEVASYLQEADTSPGAGIFHGYLAGVGEMVKAAQARANRAARRSGRYESVTGAEGTDR